ncbi:MAG: hypothetical protein ACPGVT_06810 [Maricaulaceae bacterium]
MRTQQIITAILIAIGASVAIYQAMQPDFGRLKFKVRGNVAYGYGFTDSNSASLVTKLLRDNPEVDTLVLKKMSGTQDADTNLKLARHIRRNHLKTHLDKNSYIASGAVDLFIAGVERTMECGALIGVHSWSISGRKIGQLAISPKDMGVDRRQGLHERFLRDMGVDPDFYVYTREAAEPEDIYFVPPDDVERFGLLTQPANCD